ncbi:MAG TPA: selenium cofactor biosynthesis protein YqeC [Acetobacteraceae bacterium]|nr:selenium cofactor biosynthesis protein YqeC [Acetobacteraceae bacterium]
MEQRLAQALGIGEREVVTIVGGGGKTTTMFRLGRELRAAGAGVVLTTTTHIFAPAPEADLETVVEQDAARSLAKLREALGRGHLPVVGTDIKPDGRLGGVSSEVADYFAEHPDLAYVIVEADGSAHKPFKAPLEYEPVVPASTTLLVAVVGVDALGMPLDAEHIHRPLRVAELSGAELNQPLSAEAIASVLVHPLGPLRDAPHGARVLVLLNKADSPERIAAARAIASELRAVNGPPVIIGAVASAALLDPI